jgi:hypothetical protein
VSFLGSLRARGRERLRTRSVVSLVRIACWAALLALAIMCLSIIDPAPLTVIFAMSVGHVIGAFAFVCYLLSVLIDSVRRGSDPPGNERAKSEGSAPR